MSVAHETLLTLLNVFFLVFHFALILFNLTGWIITKFRKWHLLSMLAIVFSWFVLGIFYGWGYCFLTDWHYQVQRELGLVVDSSSHIHFLLKRINMDWWPERVTDLLTGMTFGVLFLLSLTFNLRDILQRKKHKKSHSGRRNG